MSVCRRAPTISCAAGGTEIADVVGGDAGGGTDGAPEVGGLTGVGTTTTGAGAADDGRDGSNTDVSPSTSC